MDWYYPVLTGASTGERRQGAPGRRWDDVRDGGPRHPLRQRRAVGDRVGDRRVRASPSPRSATSPPPPTCCAGPAPTAATTARTGPGSCTPAAPARALSVRGAHGLHRRRRDPRRRRDRGASPAAALFVPHGAGRRRLIEEGTMGEGGVPLSRRPLRQRHAHARLQLQAVDRRQGDRRRPVDPRLPAGDRRRVRHRSTHPLRAPRRPRPNGRATTPAGPSTADRNDDRRDGHVHVRLPLHVLRLLQLPRRLHARVRRASSASGPVVHPQQWPEDLDYAGKRVVVIGSGATAMTLVPAMAERRRPRHDAAALADLRRVAARRGRDRQRAAQGAARHAGPTRSRAARTSRCSSSSTGQTRTQPEKVKAQLLGMVRKELGPDYDVDTHFTPTLQPVGPAAVPGAQQRPVRGDPRPARRRSSPIRSTRSPRRASSSSRARSSTPTSSSPRPG